jgi:hypothetical protein
MCYLLTDDESAMRDKVFDVLQMYVSLNAKLVTKEAVEVLLMTLYHLFDDSREYAAKLIGLIVKSHIDLMDDHVLKQLQKQLTEDNVVIRNVCVEAINNIRMYHGYNHTNMPHNSDIMVSENMNKLHFDFNVAEIGLIDRLEWSSSSSNNDNISDCNIDELDSWFDDNNDTENNNNYHSHGHTSNRSNNNTSNNDDEYDEGEGDEDINSNSSSGDDDSWEEDESGEEGGDYGLLFDNMLQTIHNNNMSQDIADNSSSQDIHVSPTRASSVLDPPTNILPNSNRDSILDMDISDDSDFWI